MPTFGAGLVAELDQLLAAEILVVLDRQRHPGRGGLRGIAVKTVAHARDEERPFGAERVAVAAEEAGQHKADRLGAKRHGRPRALPLPVRA